MEKLDKKRKLFFWELLHIFYVLQAIIAISKSEIYNKCSRGIKLSKNTGKSDMNIRICQIFWLKILIFVWYTNINGRVRQ